MFKCLELFTRETTIKDKGAWANTEKNIRIGLVFPVLAQ
jgi:hypothetical protein